MSGVSDAVSPISLDLKNFANLGAKCSLSPPKWPSSKVSSSFWVSFSHEKRMIIYITDNFPKKIPQILDLFLTAGSGCVPAMVALSSMTDGSAFYMGRKSFLLFWLERLIFFAGGSWRNSIDFWVRSNRFFLRLTSVYFSSVWTELVGKFSSSSSE